MTAVDERTIDDAARRLESGELVAFPTETVYGLGADASNPAAVARISHEFSFARPSPAIAG